jgi:hypothetical protein
MASCQRCSLGNPPIANWNGKLIQLHINKAEFRRLGDLIYDKHKLPHNNINGKVRLSLVLNWLNPMS